MTVIDIDPLVLKDVLLTIGETNDYRKAVDQVMFTPASSQVTWTGLGLNSHSDVTTATWTVTLNYAQDWETTDSLSAYLFEHEGETVTMEFAPRSGTGPSFLVDVIITPGAIGGSVNQFATTGVTLGCKARPTIVPAA